jgi:transposase-like protein
MLFLIEILKKSDVSVDHITLNRWMIRYSLLITEEAKKQKRSMAIL